MYSYRKSCGIKTYANNPMQPNKRMDKNAFYMLNWFLKKSLLEKS
ncbi:hypothetical protein Cycma_2343 [Cyclobacterium marinum DSM 745]|uniref:Uncharacterized protein n=1 Tax=Cyclobacterium marinum (strain ATCC 25205 / DSM 745 / LMG 13164 / NCIMB 1802) TaxID=880070 RepID=G0J622_CYCMS|nr:hypothetical protein Cycma_2343 [Cyclobacterium marinum DSM 745]